jgi:GNAT superfamily N-acetyltransferase
LTVQIRHADPQGADAVALLHDAAVEVHAFYPELFAPGSPPPVNPPTPARGVYLLAYRDGSAVACGALRPLDDRVAEVQRMFVRKSARRSGVARSMLAALEEIALDLGYTRLRLETGKRQTSAIALYLSEGFARCEPFGEHVGDPFSVCFEKAIAPDVDEKPGRATAPRPRTRKA